MSNSSKLYQRRTETRKFEETHTAEVQTFNNCTVEKRNTTQFLTKQLVFIGTTHTLRNFFRTRERKHISKTTTEDRR